MRLSLTIRVLATVGLFLAAAVIGVLGTYSFATTTFSFVLPLTWALCGLWPESEMEA